MSSRPNMQSLIPKWAKTLLSGILKPEFLEEIEGDLEEVMDDYREKNSGKSSTLFLLKELIKLLRWNLVKSVRPSTRMSPFAIFRHNLIWSLRGFARQKTSFFINLVGLTTGLAATLVIFLWIEDEYKIDGFHSNKDRLYQVLEHRPRSEGIVTTYYSPFILSEALSTSLPEVEYAVTIGEGEMTRNALLSTDTNKVQAYGTFASTDFFSSFSFPLIEGSTAEVLKKPNAIVLSESLAISLFGAVDAAIGQTIKGNRSIYNDTFEVTGVFKDIQDNSTIQYEYFINHRVALKHETWLDEWSAGGANTYIVVRNGTDLSQLNEKLKLFYNGIEDREGHQLMAYPFHKLHLKGDFANGKAVGGRISYVRIIGFSGVFVLLIACINFMNLATAQASRRAKSIGVKKVFGIRRNSLILQFFTESFLITFFSYLMALLVVSLLLPGINTLVGKSLSISPDFNLLSFVLVTLFGASFISGLYPSVYLSRFQPNDILQGRLKSGIRDLWVRKGLVVMQFSISIIFAIGFLTFNKQIDFIQQTDLGYNRENLIHFSLRESEKRQTFLNQLQSIPGVESVTNLFGGSIANLRGAGGGFSWGNPVENEEIMFRRPQVGYSFFETLDIELLEGRTFSKEFNNESQKLVINQAAADLIGINDLVGKTIIDSDVEKEVIGIVKNFKIKSLYEPMQPTIIRFTPRGGSFMVRISRQNQPETLKSIEKAYNELNSEYPFNPRFVDDQYNQLYNSEQNIAKLASYFTVIALIVACLGLFGLATFTTERRTKEIGIRKILGASKGSIIALLTGSFTKTVLISILVALPLGYYLAGEWLNNFAYSISLNWWIFVATGLSCLLISWLTVGLQTLKASSVNPAECLRHE